MATRTPEAPEAREARAEGGRKIRTEEETMEKWQCQACGYIYDPSIGDPDHNIPPGIEFEDLPENWVCPQCGVGKEFFQKLD
jgi:rubredoxin